MEPSPPAVTSDRLFAGDSQAEHILQGIDWRQHDLGPVAHWPATLRTALRICLTSRHAMIIWWGKDLTFFYNDAYAPTLGPRHPQAMGRPGQAVWPEIWDVIGPMLRGVMATGTATWSDDQLLFLERNGYPEETYHSFSYSPIERDDGTVVGVFTAATETTTRVLMERRAALARDLAGALVEAHTTEEVAQQAATVLATHPLDVPTTLIYRVEPDGTTLTRIAAVNVAATPVANGHEADANMPWLRAAIHASPEAEVVPWGALPFTGAVGWAPHQALALPITEPGQHVPTLLWVAGISPRRELDADYQALFTLLQGHLRTALAAAHAYEAERLRAEAYAALDRAKTVFFSNVSHEFRTPLTLMLGPIADSLADQANPLPPEQQARLTVVQRNSLRLLKLVNTLLDFSRIEAGRIQARYAPTDLAAYTAELASAFRSLVESAGMQLIIACPPLPEPVYVDRDMWEKIVLNLLTNAFKFTFSGSIRVQLRAANRQVILEVADTGTGIPAEELPRLFERFHRVEGARSRTQEGSGIGLALIQELIQLHGGTIAATSAVGTGTTFTLTLPLGTAHLPADRLEHAETPPSTTMSATAFIAEAERWLPAASQVATWELPAAPLEREEPLVAPGAVVLVADDNADMREYLARLLSGHYQVRTVANGAQALMAMRASLPDLVLSDVMMPELDGFGLVQAIQDDPRTAMIPVILLSARAGEEATVEGLASGAADYLVKPFSARELLARVAAQLALAGLRREVHQQAAELAAVFESVTDGVAVYDNAGQILRANAVMKHHLARLQAARPDAGADDDQVDGAIATAWPLTRILQGESLADDTALEVEIPGGDGEALALSVTGAPLRDATGSIVGAVVVSRDVTERRRQERVVRERARQLQAIFESVADGMVIYDTQGRLVEWNAALAALFEFDRRRDYADLDVSERPEEILVRDAAGQPVAPADLPFMRAVRGEVVTGTHAVDLQVTLPSGRRARVNVSAAPLYDAGQHIVGSVAVYRDVTERRHLEHRVQQALEGLLEFTEMLVGAAPRDDEATPSSLNVIGVRLVSLLQRVFASDMASMSTLDPQTGHMQPLGVIGLEPEVAAQWWLDVPRTPLDAYLAPATLARIYAGETVEIDIDAEPFRNGARYGVHRILMAPMLLGSSVIGLMAIEQQQSQRLYEANDFGLMRAMGRLSALTIEWDRLMREQVVASAREEALAEANRRMNEFLGIASHELRTPLTSVMANLQLSERGLRGLVASDDDPRWTKLGRYHRLLVQSDRQLKRLNRLISDLLDVSRITAGKLELRLERLDLLALVQEVAQAQQAVWPHRVVELDLAQHTPVMVVADSDRIEQVLINFVTNALKYSPADQPVHIRVRKERKFARVSIQDHGPGLTPEQQSRLFERFERIPAITQQDGSGIGLGLGLYICKTIIDRHGGTVSVASAVGQGSTFSFTVPRE